MALTKPRKKVLFGAANSVVITTGSNNISDLITTDDTCIEASITLKADNAGTPVLGDTVDVYILKSSGDPDGAAVADEFASADLSHATFLGQIDTFVTDPGIIDIPFPVVPANSKLYAINNSAGSVTFSAVIEEMRSA